MKEELRKKFDDWALKAGATVAPATQQWTSETNTKEHLRTASRTPANLEDPPLGSGKRESIRTALAVSSKHARELVSPNYLCFKSWWLPIRLRRPLAHPWGFCGAHCRLWAPRRGTQGSAKASNSWRAIPVIPTYWYFHFFQ